VVFPKHPDDLFGGEIGRKNLAFIAANYRSMGISTLVIADVVERDDDKAALQQALPDYQVHVVRLRVPMHLIKERLTVRETTGHLQWYLDRAPELERIMDAANVGDTIIDVGERGAGEVAEEIAQRLHLL